MCYIIIIIITESTYNSQCLLISDTVKYYVTNN